MYSLKLYRGFESLSLRHKFESAYPLSVFMVASVGPLASLDRELRQARKGATAAIDASAEDRLAEAITFNRSARLRI